MTSQSFGRIGSRQTDDPCRVTASATTFEEIFLNEASGVVEKHFKEMLKKIIFFEKLKKSEDFH